MQLGTSDIVRAVVGVLRAHQYWLSAPATACVRRSESGSDSEDEREARPRKAVPKWARGAALSGALAAQSSVDPDEIFQLHAKTCPLSEVFSQPGAPGCAGGAESPVMRTGLCMDGSRGPMTCASSTLVQH